MMNSGAAMGNFIQAFNTSITGELALSWIRSLPVDQEHQQDIIRIFNDFWIRGMIITHEPQGKGNTLGEFKSLNPLEVERSIMALEDISENEKYKRIEYYKKFRKWTDAPWCKDSGDLEQSL